LEDAIVYDLVSLIEVGCEMWEGDGEAFCSNCEAEQYGGWESQ